MPPAGYRNWEEMQLLSFPPLLRLLPIVLVLVLTLALDLPFVVLSGAKDLPWLKECGRTSGPILD